MSESSEAVRVYEEYGGPHVGRAITIERDGEIEYRLMNIGGIAVVPVNEDSEWIIDALIENDYEWTTY
jgi:hypothetical protein